MQFKNELYKIFDSIYDENFAYCNKRLDRINMWGEHLDQLIELFYRLEDTSSKNTFMRLLKYNFSVALNGNTKRNSLFSQQEWNSFIEESNKIPHVEDDYQLDRIETFILEGYNYRNICCAQKDDYVIDCGAYTGNTSLYFSDRVGKGGKVFSFEAMPSTYNRLKQNMDRLNRKNINTYNYAVSDKRKVLFFTETATPGSRQITSGTGIKVEALSIDDFVRENNLSRVDFIKMDVEGAELDILNGCTETCKKFSPALAVCLYHKADDFITLPAKILQIDPNYRFYLKHNSNRFSETVLFAIRQDTSQNISIPKDEVDEVRYLWNIFIKIHASKQKAIRKHLITSYIENLKNINTIPLQVKIDTSNFAFAYFPLSSDNKLHYEFLFMGDSVRVSLHFEKEYMNHVAVIQEIIHSCKLSGIQLRHISSTREECCFIVPNVYDVQYIAKLMNYLISISFPILKSYGLLSDQIMLDNI